MVPFSWHQYSVTGLIVPFSRHLYSVTGLMVPFSRHLHSVTGLMVSFSRHPLAVTGSMVPFNRHLHSVNRVDSTIQPSPTCGDRVDGTIQPSPTCSCNEPSRCLSNICILRHRPCCKRSHSPRRIQATHIFLKYVFLGAFTKLPKVTISFVMYVCPSVSGSVRQHGTTHLPLDGLLWNLILEDLSKTARKIQVF